MNCDYTTIRASTYDDKDVDTVWETLTTAIRSATKKKCWGGRKSLKVSRCLAEVVGQRGLVVMNMGEPIEKEKYNLIRKK